MADLPCVVCMNPVDCTVAGRCVARHGLSPKLPTTGPVEFLDNCLVADPNGYDWGDGTAFDNVIPWRDKYNGAFVHVEWEGREYLVIAVEVQS